LRHAFRALAPACPGTNDRGSLRRPCTVNPARLRPETGAFSGRHRHPRGLGRGLTKMA
jgi:hypothetical protein